MKEKFIPVILGSDINTYNMAISFHEAYGIYPIVLGQAPMQFTTYSSITKNISYNERLHEADVLVAELEAIASKYRDTGEKLILVATNDVYVRLVIENAERLSKHFIFNYINEQQMEQILVKKNFYKLCEEHGIDIPTTHIFDCASDKTFREEMMYPVIIKPSNGVNYFKHGFPGQQKVYKLDSLKEVQTVISEIQASGYTDDLIIQDFIPGDDTYMWDAVVYINSRKKPQVVSFGQVALQEHTVTGVGNYTAVITRYNEELMTKLVQFLQDLDYVGFANFDLKYDYRDGKYKVFEVNIRQGRSSYYITQCGHNMAELFVDDLILEKETALQYINKDYLFTVVPKIVLRKFVKNKEIKREINKLIKQKKYGNPLFYKKDTSLKRKLFLFLRQVNYYRKYKNNTW